MMEDDDGKEWAVNSHLVELQFEGKLREVESK
jgi:hypothetical protein